MDHCQTEQPIRESEMDWAVHQPIKNHNDIKVKEMRPIPLQYAATTAGTRVSQAFFKCLSCGHETNADVNAAENIRHQGVETLARAGNLSLGVPPETIAVNKRNKPRHKADPRCTRELALRKE